MQLSRVSESKVLSDRDLVGINEFVQSIACILNVTDPRFPTLLHPRFRSKKVLPRLKSTCQLLCLPTIFTNRNGPSNCRSHQCNNERIHCMITTIIALQTN